MPGVDERKRCTLCKVEKLLDAFPRHRNRPDGRSVWCKPCHAAKSRAWRLRNPDVAKATAAAWKARNPLSHRASSLRRRYGIEESDYDALLAAQDGRCAICGAKESDSAKTFLCIDHVAGTALIRGLLCSRCNSAIGLLGHDVQNLQRAIEYLSRSPVHEGQLSPWGVHRSRLED